MYSQSKIELTYVFFVSQDKQHVCSSHIVQTERMTVSLHTPHLMSITKTTESNQWGLDLAPQRKEK